MARVPDTYKLPFDRKAFSGDDPEAEIEYLRRLVLKLQGMYSELANAVNNNYEEFKDHTSHPP